MSHPWRLPMALSARGTADFAPFRSAERSGWMRVTCLNPASTRAARRFLSCRLPPQAGLLAGNPRVINLYLAVQGLPNGIHHRPAEFVKHHPRGLVAGKTELTLHQQSGHATLVSGHQ